jgi:hypothetical protein
LQEEFEDTKGAIRILHMPIYPYYSQCKARFNINDWITAIFELCVGKVEIEGKKSDLLKMKVYKCKERT